jgi:hypothetical protein
MSDTCHAVATTEKTPLTPIVIELRMTEEVYEAEAGSPLECPVCHEEPTATLDGFVFTKDADGTFDAEAQTFTVNTQYSNVDSEDVDNQRDELCAPSGLRILSCGTHYFTHPDIEVD